MPISDPPEVSIVIPAFHEAARLEGSVRALQAYLQKTIWSREVILAIEHGTDGTLELAQRLTEADGDFRVLGLDAQKGKGHAVRAGMRAARGEIAFFMDVDLSTPLRTLDEFLSHFSKHLQTDVIVGNRQHPESVIVRRQSWLRQKMGQMFNALLRRMTGLQLLDTQCGFKAFRREARAAIFAQQRLDGFAFDVEVLLLAKSLKLRVDDR